MIVTRKLAAILVADIVGYSRLAGADEDRVHHREDREIGAQAHGQRGNGGEGEAGCPPELAHSVSEIADHGGAWGA